MVSEPADIVVGPNACGLPCPARLTKPTLAVGELKLCKMNEMHPFSINGACAYYVLMPHPSRDGASARRPSMLKLELHPRSEYVGVECADWLGRRWWWLR